MFHGFRQNMAWLHTWTGLLAGWVLYFVFLTGTFGYVNVEVDHWMRPEEPMVASPPPASDLVAKAERRLIGQAADAGHWSIGLPGGRQGHRLTVAWVERPAGDGAPPARMAETLDLHSGLPVTYASRDTGGGFTLYWMHFFLHYVPRDVGIRIVGICSMFMLVAILTGVVAHRRIFRDFFTFRPGKGQRSWLDAHNLLGVTSLPFHVMITWSGLIFYLFAYMPAGFDILYPEGEARARLAVYSYGIERPPLPAREHAEPGPPAPLASLPAILSEAEKRWGSGAVARIEVDHPHRGNARITVTSQPISTVGRRDAPQLSFDGTTGRSLNEKPPHRSAPDRFHSVMLGLHEAHFAGPFLRALFIGAGLAGTAMIATGLLLWSAKRRA